jgi:ketosteroid isomerase-like protein
MRLPKEILLVCCGLLALAGSPIASAGDDPTATDTFRKGTAEWVSAYNAGDADRVLALYADDAVVMPPDASTASGHADIRAFLDKEMASAKAAGITLAVSDGGAGASGNLGWHDGTYAVRDAEGKSVATGKYLEVWERRGGKWLIVRDIWNNDAAATPAAEATD